MKTLKSIIVLLLLVSCSTEPIETPNNEEHNSKKSLQNKTGMPCDYNLENNGCIFISGEGKPAGSYNTMLYLLNNCDAYTEPLPANCKWWKNYQQTVVLSHKFRNYPCEDAETMNNHLNVLKNKAQENRPNDSFLIVGYELQSTNSWPGYFELTYRVIYRKKICSLKGDGINFQ